MSTTEAAASMAAEAMTDAVEVSVLVPVVQRAAPPAALYAEYSAPLRASGIAYEFVFIASPWQAAAHESLLELSRAGEPVRILEGGQPMGEGALVRLAAERSRGRLIVTLPAYRRVEADAILDLVARVDGGADLVVARRWPRTDSWVNRVQNRALHALIGGMARNRIHDVASGVAAMPRDFLLWFPLYGDFLRFLPLLAVREGYRVEEVDATQHPEDRSARIYSPGIYLRRLLDILGLFFLVRFMEKPLRFFGMLGSISGLLGVLVLAVGAVQRLVGEEGLADRPLLLFGVLLLVVGIQAIALGLIGEIIVHLNARRTPSYRVRRDSQHSA